MRSRKRKNTIIRQYKYRVSTHEWPLPPEVWDIARRMQMAWNTLVVLYESSDLQLLNRDFAESWEMFKKDKDEEFYKFRTKTLNALKKERWLEWDRQAREAILPFGLDYSQGPNVLERFNAGIKAGRTLQQHDATELSAVQIPLVFPGSAAIPVRSLLEADGRRRWRLVLEGYDDRLYLTNSRENRRHRRLIYLALGLSRAVSVELRVDMHRPLPEGGLIKRVLLSGRRRPFAGWRWHVLFQIEIPVRAIAAETEREVWLRIGWARFDEGIIVARWKDSLGEEGALLMPLSPANHRDRRTEEFHRRLVERGAEEWPDRLRGYLDLRVYRASERELAGEERMLMRARRRRVEERWQARRRELYRNFATWLVRRFALIHLPKVDIKAMGESEKEGALAAADRWRQIAAPGDLLATIKELAEKAGRQVASYKQTTEEFRQPLELDASGWFERDIREGARSIEPVQVAGD